MLNFQFLPTYIKNKEYCNDDLRIEIIEMPCHNPNEEEYRFRIKTRHNNEEIIIHRDIAIEHHQPKDKHPHGFEHLQFKLSTEMYGKIRINLDIKNEEEYKNCILGFLDILKDIIKNYERYDKDITEKVLNLQMFIGLEKHRRFLQNKISSSLIHSRIEMQTSTETKIINKELIANFKSNEALLPFFEGIK